ncbi:tRNA (adenosine(37)-N6)-threonylcarbamoyltransferase complex dimerization subunit type 1 TsaB [Isobaculum melis]|uniref:tRNA threonylcarbamoyladenosine biosynthesis protein TsaB n=1 Tax=Isobaculum melis TaxID=142588 RepID=A0A1H9TGB1_9LACT|nr:tRNA (adenosine(37)-N6)-threonylcarbamoyltransferase complex dimerization subunit type 1 TsaB [Isobaculum melis]SER96255.1 tRNA threonylcarbamoyladenosine biosynthesis protein TsaB [Isobaculum melis]
MKILAIDTSNQVMTIALLEDQTILGELTTNIKGNHSTRLMPGIDQLMKEVGMVPNQLEKIVVAKGPGSYTGLRIGVVIAKTLAWTLDIPLVGISSLKSLAGNVRHFEGVIVPIFDARRDNIYTGAYQYKGKQLAVVIPDQHIAAEKMSEQLEKINQPILFVGMDAEQFDPIFKKHLSVAYDFAAPEENMPSACVLGRLGLAEAPSDTHEFLPSYLKLAEAEENWQKAHPELKGGNFIEKI